MGRAPRSLMQHLQPSLWPGAFAPRHVLVLHEHVAACLYSRLLVRTAFCVRNFGLDILRRSNVVRSRSSLGMKFFSQVISSLGRCAFAPHFGFTAAEDPPLSR